MGQNTLPRCLVCIWAQQLTSAVIVEVWKEREVELPPQLEALQVPAGPQRGRGHVGSGLSLGPRLPPRTSPFSVPLDLLVPRATRRDPST